ncbi:MAG: dihydroxy-acid dehydratase, partial [Thermoplasmata archaeon]|nr:dihydroxy-acid dehydratase [Thermoplasmata archaeon]
CVGHVSPEAYVGGALAALRDGDIIRIDLDARDVDVLISEREIKARLKERRLPKQKIDGYLRRYRDQVSSASLGAILQTSSR